MRDGDNGDNENTVKKNNMKGQGRREREEEEKK
jgi:hypothetical protein